MNLPDPNTAQINRYYTIEFLKELKARLEKDAVVSFGLSSSADYLSEEARQVKSIFYTTLASVFNNIIVVAGLKDYFIASDNKLDLHIGKLVEKRNINNLYVNKYYLDDNVLAQRNEFILSNLSNKTKLNEDFSPICYFRQLQLWLSYFEFNYWIAVGIFIILLISILTRLNPVTIGIFTGGIAASSIEVILLIAFQIMYGYVYQTLGIIIMIFMGGLAIGSYFRNKIILKTNIRVYSFVQYSITLFATILPFFLQFLKNSTFNIHLLHFVFYLPTFIIALIIGIEFSIASHIYKGTVTYIASQLYGIDLIGSALGALIVTTFLIPLLGLNNTCYIIAGLNLISGTISLVSETRTN